MTRLLSVKITVFPKQTSYVSLHPIAAPHTEVLPPSFVDNMLISPGLVSPLSPDLTSYLSQSMLSTRCYNTAHQIPETSLLCPLQL